MFKYFAQHFYFRKVITSSGLIIAILSLSIFIHVADATEISYYIYDVPDRSVTALTNSSGEVINQYKYDGFGNLLDAAESVDNNYKYVGEREERESKLIFLRKRYYDPTIGRFVTKDPKPGTEKNPQSLNSYIYCLNNPILLSDPSGEIVLATAIIAGALVVGYITQMIAWAFGLYPSRGLFGGATATNVMYEVEQYNRQQRDRDYYYGGGPGGGGGSSLSTRSSLSSSGSLRSSLSRSYGGVSLSKTAQLMLNINDVAGATYDERTGQVILFGKEDLSLPQMDTDDLKVAVDSVYSGQDPGVSIGTEPSEVPGWMKVRYDGLTRDTQFGKVMFDSDRLLKSLDMGFDNVTRQQVSSSVPGYQNMIQRELYGDFTSGTYSERKWFKPKDMKLTKNTTGDAMVFSEVSMELLTETTFQGGSQTPNPESEAFASHFTQHYDEFANEFPVLKELKKLGKITSVVKWIKDNNIPLDMSFLNDYEVEYAPCERYTSVTIYIFLAMMMVLGLKERLWMRRRREWVRA